MKIPKWSITPTDDVIRAFKGMHCSKLWAQLGPEWCCPSCKRLRDELIRWSDIRGPTWRKAYGDEYGMGWTTSLHGHHCHGLGRFSETVICGDCNSADGAAKRRLGLPQEWSFSPEEIGQFVSVTPFSGKTTIDYEKAQEIYSTLTASLGGH